jgi:hypothetical protein
MNVDLQRRISDLIKHSQGTMPVGLLVAGKSEAEEALRILAKEGAGKIVTAYVRVDGYDIQFKPDSPAKPE